MGDQCSGAIFNSGIYTYGRKGLQFPFCFPFVGEGELGKFASFGGRSWKFQGGAVRDNRRKILCFITTI